jgi:hypothetical protein
MWIFVPVTRSRDFWVPLQFVIPGALNRLIRHLKSKPLFQPRADALIALKAFWMMESRLQLRQRFSVNARRLATATPMTDDERLKTVVRILRDPSRNRFSLNVQGLGNRVSSPARSDFDEKERGHSISSLSVVYRVEEAQSFLLTFMNRW